jgi:hypothetical protein
MLSQLKNKRWLILAILLAVVSMIVYGLVRSKMIVPPPKLSCTTETDWRGIRPGVTTRQEVMEILGPPAQTGSLKFRDGKNIPFVAYPIEGGLIANYFSDRIFFRGDDRVDWIEEAIGDRSGEFVKAQEAVNEFGTTLDAVYESNSLNPFAWWQYDVITDPAEVMVWSECGIAVIASLVDDNQVGSSLLSYRYSEKTNVVISKLDGFVYMRFYFQPTTYPYFKKEYAHRIPYGVWRYYSFELSKIYNNK